MLSWHPGWSNIQLQNLCEWSQHGRPPPPEKREFDPEQPGADPASGTQSRHRRHAHPQYRQHLRTARHLSPSGGSGRPSAQSGSHHGDGLPPLRRDRGWRRDGQRLADPLPATGGRYQHGADAAAVGADLRAGSRHAGPLLHSGARHPQRDDPARGPAVPAHLFTDLPLHRQRRAATAAGAAQGGHPAESRQGNAPWPWQIPTALQRPAATV